MTSRPSLPDDPLWYKDSIIYEVRVRSFFDSDADGVGDFRGLTEKLDYLEDLGVTALWLLPFYPSPLRDDGYDISDYTTVHPDLGTLSDFKVFLREAHRRGLRVITELVVNHTSDQHPWFQRARRAKPGSKWRNFYVWSDTPTKYADARIIFTDFEPSNWTWDPIAKQYYWHRFFSHQPDLNYDNPEVEKAIFQVLDFWMDLGVDGLRLDAIPYLYEREGTNCENLPETHAFLRKLRAHIDENYPNRMLLAEANQWPEDAAAYFGNGDECHMNFHFPIMPRLYMAVEMQDRFPVVDILAQTPVIPESAQWAIFLRNHDELTLEMVTDEERHYMYRVFAHDQAARINLGIRRRLAPLLRNSRNKIELLNALLFSLPGTPVVYYGDEIGMGDNFYLGDRNGVRTPMQWSGDLNAGFSRGNPQRLFLPIIIDPEYHYQTVNVETQSAQDTSLLSWMKRIVELRKRYRAFGRGTFDLLAASNTKVLAFLRCHAGETILVVANLSPNVQPVELDLSKYRGRSPIELFGRTRLPAIGDGPYFLTLGPHDFFWLALEEPRPSAIATGRDVPVVSVRGDWTAVLEGRGLEALEGALPEYLRERRWFGGKARLMRAVSLREVLVVPAIKDARILFVEVAYDDGGVETYVIPIAYGEGARAEQVVATAPHAPIVRLTIRQKGGPPGEGLLYDALVDREFAAELLTAIAKKGRFRGTNGEAVGVSTQVFRAVRGPDDSLVEPESVRLEQSNTSIVYGQKLIMKIFRAVEPGVQPDLEVGRYLTEEAKFAHAPPVAGYLEYRRGRSTPITLALLQGFVANQGDAWTHTAAELERYFDRARAAHPVAPPHGDELGRALDLVGDDPSPLAFEMFGSYLEQAHLLGQRAAELHRALAAATDDADFAPEPFSTLYQRSLYQSMRNRTGQVMQLLREWLRELPAEVRPHAERVLGLERAILSRFESVRDAKINTVRTRIHGDFHLGQVLWTGKDFVIIDFEGEPARPLTERRIKRSPLRDVAAMLRSFDYAAFTALGRLPAGTTALEPWARYWRTWTSAAFLRGYLGAASGASFLPSTRQDLVILLDAYVLEKALYEIAYELNNRPSWVRIPLGAIEEMIARDPESR